MAELDLPPISIQRYLDLLKRRRWQVVPLSILGLVVGGLVAFFIPRYYVASTTIKYNGTFISTVDVRREDPIAGALSLARNTLPLYVPEVLQKLRWSEVMTEDRAARRSFERKIKDRVGLEDIGSPEKGRTTTQLRLTYRDTDGQRAADFVNALREYWKERTQQEISDGFENNFRKLNEALDRARTNIINVRNERARFEQANKIDPQAWRVIKDRGESQRGERLRDSQRRCEALRTRLATLEASIPELKRQLEDTSPYLSSNLGNLSSAERHRLDDATSAVITAEASLKALNPAHPYYRMLQQQLDSARSALKTIQASFDAGSVTRQEENPRWTEAKRRLGEAERERAEKKQELANEEQVLALLEKELERLPTIFQDYDSILERLERAQEELKDLDKQRQKAEAAQRDYVNAQPFETMEAATVPERPTEPNITLVALGGCILGLALAIVLILALDMLRTTFKTLDDVERGIAVPVLGSLAHMETREEREVSQRKRARASLVAGAFLTLVVAIVTIYYVAPARLPTVVTKALGYVLGATK